MLEKPLQYWAVLAAITLYAFINSAEPVWWKRFSRTLVSVGLAYGFSDDLVARTGWSETLASSIILIVGIVVLDVAFFLANDRNYLTDLTKAVLEKRLGVSVKKRDDNDA